MKNPTQFVCTSLAGIISTAALLLFAAGASAQNLFVSDYSTGNIYEYSPGSGGTQTTFASGLANPSGLAFDQAGDLFAAAQGNGSIYEFVNNNGILSHTASLYASGLSTPGDMAFDAAGDMFIANYDANNIIEISAHGVRSTFASGQYLNLPLGLAFNAAGNLFVGNAGNNSITEITPAGTQINFATGLSEPGLGLAFDGTGNLLVGNLNHYIGGSITSVSPNGVLSPFASGFTPDQMAFTSSGTLLVADSRTPNILAVGPNGQSTIYDTGTTDPNGLAIQGEILPVPEPTTLALATVGVTGLLIGRLRKKA